MALLVGTILGLSALLFLHLLPDQVSVVVGQPSNQDVRAPRTVQYVDEIATNSLRDAAAARVIPVYSTDRYAQADADQAVQDIYSILRRERDSGGRSAMHAAVQIRQNVDTVLGNPDVLLPLLTGKSGRYQLDDAQRLTESAVSAAMDNDIRDDHVQDLQRARLLAAGQIAASALPRDWLPGVTALAEAVIRSNRQMDFRATASQREAARANVTPQISQIFAGQIIVRHGEIVTPDVIAQLRALGLQNPRLKWGAVLSITLLVAFMVAIVMVYLYRFQPAVYGSTRTLLLLAILVGLSFFQLKLAGSLLGVHLTEVEFGYAGMMCVSASAMLIAALINARLATFVTALMAALSGLILANDLRFCLMTMVSGTVAIFAVADIRNRSDVLRTVAVLATANIALAVVLGQIQGDPLDEIPQSIVWAVFAAGISVGIFWLGGALFERLFGIATHLRLLELSDPNKPLLQKFCQIAPGTYTHSVIVGNLAVVAAEAIGADTLLCRVGSYYHDLGKMNRPDYFVENQAGGLNVHERLSPSLSALILTQHVRDGIEIADREKLPQVIKDFITEHHGTSLIKYFYHQQTNGDGDAVPGLEQHFRYAGPKPQSRETAILMLADSVEAASRTLDKPTPGRITDLVERIINTQLADGQLDECDLTLMDLRRIRDAFIRLLSGTLHNRVEYPELLKDQKLEKNGPADMPSDIPVSQVDAVRAAEGAKSGAGSVASL
jgi:hypothetical protein